VERGHVIQLAVMGASQARAFGIRYRFR
jgi:hypothetical protein